MLIERKSARVNQHQLRREKESCNATLIRDRERILIMLYKTMDKFFVLHIMGLTAQLHA